MLLLSGIKIVGVPQASLVIVIALGVGAAALLGYGLQQLVAAYLRPTASQVDNT